MSQVSPSNAARPGESAPAAPVPRHVNLLGILAGIWGGLAMLVGVSMLLLALGALAELRTPRADMALAAGVAAGMFGLLGAFALVWGAAHAWAAALMRRRRSTGRILMLALALVDLLVLPFGTALGVYALWVLLTEQGRRHFEAPAAA